VFEHLNDLETKIQIKHLITTKASLSLWHSVMLTDCVSGNLKMQFVNLLRRFGSRGSVVG
jgi:hypothetical protein